MSEQVILNASATWDDAIRDNICPDYGFSVKLPNTRARVKAPGGQPVSRETSNDGHTFALNWLNRSFACTEVLKRFYDQYQDGYFTLIDRDGGGRHYVGRFTGDFTRVQVANDTYDVRDLTFEEVPGAPMVQYPNDWANDSMALPAFNDFGRQLAATNGDWEPFATPGFRALRNTAGAGFAAMEYRGYGFELWMLHGPDQGMVQVLLDGAPILSADLYEPTTTAARMVCRKAAVPLNLHRVKVQLLGSKNNASSAAGAIFCKLQVMR